MNRQTKIVTKEYYDERFGLQDQALNEEETIRWAAIKYALEEMVNDRDIRIADFGCGRGWLSGKLSSYGSVIGFDISEKAVQNAKRAYPNIEFTSLDASLKISEEYKKNFDIVVSSEVIEHINEQQEYLNNINSILKVGGKLLITTPNGKWYKEFYENERVKWKQPIENWLTQDKLSEMLRSSNISTTICTSFNSEWIFDHKPKIDKGYLANPLIRKALKAFGLFSAIRKNLNRGHYGLNLLIIGTKINDV